MINIIKLAEELVKAEENGYELPRITEKHPDFSLTMGYRVQEELIKIKMSQGHKHLAFKMGLTSEAKMKQMKINEPIYGEVFDYMRVGNKGKVKMGELIHPKVEAEIAFVLSQDIEGPSVTPDEVLSKTEAVFPILEIIDSRFKDFNFWLPDVVADNTSASKVIYGDELFNPQNLDLEQIGVKVSINGETRKIGSSVNVLGNPVNSVALLSKMLFDQGKGLLPKGSVILTGGMTEAVAIKKGDKVVSQFDWMGNLSFDVI